MCQVAATLINRAALRLCVPPQDMRYFFLMLVFLLVCFGLTFSVLMSPASSEKLNLVTLVGSSSTGEVAGSEVQVFGSLEVGFVQQQELRVKTRYMLRCLFRVIGT